MEILITVDPLSINTNLAGADGDAYEARYRSALADAVEAAYPDADVYVKAGQASMPIVVDGVDDEAAEWAVIERVKAIATQVHQSCD